MGKGSNAGRHNSTSLSRVPVTGTSPAPAPLTQHLDGLSRLMSSTGIHAPIDTSSLELRLRQRAAALIEERQNEIDAYASSLEAALSEVARIRAHEESRLAGRISEATAGFQQALSNLHIQYLEQVKALERQAVEQLQQHRDDCDDAISARVALLHDGIACRAVSQGAAGGASARRRVHAQEPSLPRRSAASPRASLTSLRHHPTGGAEATSHPPDGPGSHGPLSGGSGSGSHPNHAAQVVRNLGNGFGGEGSWGSPILFATPRLVNAQTHRASRPNTSPFTQDSPPHTSWQRNASSVRQSTPQDDKRSVHRAALDLLGSEEEASL
ncbi:MAG: hypothetical protein WDW36_009202 [Sanguina aurantia]